MFTKIAISNDGPGVAGSKLGATSWRPRWTRHRVPRSYL